MGIQAKHIPGSIHFNTPDQMLAKLQKDEEISFTAQSGVLAAWRYHRLVDHGYTNVRRYREACRMESAGLPLEGEWFDLRTLFESRDTRFRRTGWHSRSSHDYAASRSEQIKSGASRRRLGEHLAMSQRTKNRGESRWQRRASDSTTRQRGRPGPIVCGEATHDLLGRRGRSLPARPARQTPIKPS